MPSPEQTYTEWRSGLNKPDDSLFYYHPDLERILLGLAIFAINSAPYMRNLGKAKSLTLLNIYIPDLITAWIDDNEQAFATMFPLTIGVAEIYLPSLIGAQREYPSKRKQISQLASLFTHAVSCAGDMSPALAEELLDDLSTDGEKLYSDKIKKFGDDLHRLIRRYGIDIPYSHLLTLNGHSHLTAD